MRLLFSVLLASVSWGHAISVSVSEGRFTGNRLDLGVQIPRYEAEHLSSKDLKPAFQFSGATLESSQCDPLGENLSCRLRFLYANPPPQVIEATITLSRLTVPNHIHIMRLARAGISKQAVFDRTFETDRIDFKDSGHFEQWWRGVRMGFLQVGLQPILMLLLIVLGIAARPSAYIAAAGALFFVVLPDRFYATPAFFELASAIALTYVAIEQTLFPDAKGKWFVSALVGAIEGAALAVLARPAASGAVAFGTGNLVAQSIVVFFAWRFSRNFEERWQRITFWAVTALGAFWSVWVFVKRF